MHETPSSIPGVGRSPGGGIVYPLQYSWTSLVALMVKNPPAMWENWIQSLSWEDAKEEGMATHSQCSCLENPHEQRSLAGYSPQGHKESDMRPWATKYSTAMSGNIIPTILEKGWRFTGIGRLTTFCTFMFRLRTVKSLVGISFSMLIYYNEHIMRLKAY